MIKKIKQLWQRHGFDHYSNYQRGYEDGQRHGEELFRGRDLYTKKNVRDLIKESYSVGYNEGKRDGLSVAREQALKSVKEIIWQQNKTK